LEKKSETLTKGRSVAVEGTPYTESLGERRQNQSRIKIVAGCYSISCPRERWNIRGR